MSRPTEQRRDAALRAAPRRTAPAAARHERALLARRRAGRAGRRSRPRPGRTGRGAGRSAAGRPARGRSRGATSGRKNVDRSAPRSSAPRPRRSGPGCRRSRRREPDSACRVLEQGPCPRWHRSCSTARPMEPSSPVRPVSGRRWRVAGLVAVLAIVVGGRVPVASLDQAARQAPAAGRTAPSDGAGGDRPAPVRRDDDARRARGEGVAGARRRARARRRRRAPRPVARLDAGAGGLRDRRALPDPRGAGERRVRRRHRARAPRGPGEPRRGGRGCVCRRLRVRRPRRRAHAAARGRAAHAHPPAGGGCARGGGDGEDAAREADGRGPGQGAARGVRGARVDARDPGAPELRAAGAGRRAGRGRAHRRGGDPGPAERARRDRVPRAPVGLDGGRGGCCGDRLAVARDIAAGIAGPTPSPRPTCRASTARCARVSTPCSRPTPSSPRRCVRRATW